MKRCLVYGIPFALVTALSPLARADATNGLWPDVSVPPHQEVTVDASKDAALIVGIDRYDALPRVIGAAENARDWEKYFLFGRRVAPERVALLTDQNATVESISARAKDLAQKVPEGGTLFVVFIGHGAPAEGGQKGLLLGADVRPSDASFAARSLSYEQLESLVATGTQSRTIMVLDACFSGVDSGGKTLLPNVQPVVATSLVARAKTTVLSAGTAGEYAGALPGSQRPALSYLLLGALRGWGDADGDGNVTVPEAHAYASLVLRSLPNNHEQHPQLVSDPDVEAQPLETNAREKAPDLAVIRSKLDTWRPPAPQKPEPKLRVTVACSDDVARGPDDGLEIFLDHSPASATPTGGGKTWDENKKVSVVDYIEYAITPGRHHVLVRIPGCEPNETEIEADDTVGAELRGVLRNSSGLLLRGPAGAPNWGRIAVSYWMPRSFVGNAVDGIAYSPGAQTAYGNLEYSLDAKGVFVQPGLAFRWWTLGLDLGYAKGNATRTSRLNVPTPAIESATASLDLDWFRTGARVGARFPFNVVALGLGIGGGYDAVRLRGFAPGARRGEDRDHSIYGSAWAELDAYVFCDWPVFVGFDAQVHAANVEDAGTLSITIGAAYQPNSQCKDERRIKYELTQGRERKAAAR